MTRLGRSCTGARAWDQTMATKLGWILTAVILFAGGARGQAAESCVPYDRRYEEAPLMQVKASIADGEVHFQRKAEVCPPGPESCPVRQKAYLVPGDVVFAGSELRGFRCAYYGTARGDIAAGFLPADVLEPAQDDGKLDSAFLSGTWTMLGQNPITFSAVGEREVQAKGKAIWRGRPSVVHSGSFSARAELQGDSVDFRDSTGGGNCEVKIRRRGPYLIASDNSRCGGMNVRFQGIYVKRIK